MGQACLTEEEEEEEEEEEDDDDDDDDDDDENDGKIGAFMITCLLHAFVYRGILCLLLESCYILYAYTGL